MGGAICLPVLKECRHCRARWDVGVPGWSEELDSRLVGGAGRAKVGIKTTERERMPPDNTAELVMPIAWTVGITFDVAAMMSFTEGVEEHF